MPGKKSANQLRIIGGRWRSRRLLFPSVAGLRPSGDRVRETLFNWLTPVLPGAHCLDLFAGSGALGFEAGSRGAGEVVLLELNKAAADQLEANCRLLGADNLRVHRAEACRWLSQSSPALPQQRFDIVFLDPPFQAQLVEPCCQLLEDNHWLAPGARVYVETQVDNFPQVPASWRLEKEKRAGQVAFRLFVLPSNRLEEKPEGKPV